MVNAIGKIMITLAALVPAQGMKEAIKLPLAEQDSAQVRVMPHRTECPDCDGKFERMERGENDKRRERVRHADGNYVVDGEMNVSADERYQELKAALDERFARMFELKAALDRAQSEMSNKWEEYYTLHDKYNKELKKIVGMWVMEQNYTESK